MRMRSSRKIMKQQTTVFGMDDDSDGSISMNAKLNKIKHLMLIDEEKIEKFQHDESCASESLSSYSGHSQKSSSYLSSQEVSISHDVPEIVDDA